MKLVVLLVATLAAAAPAAERKLFVSSFDRLRVEGPFQVVVTAGRSPGGRLAGDPRQLDGIEVRQDGNNVVVRAIGARGDEARGPAAQPVVVTLTTPSLAAASLIGSGALSVTGMKADRVDLSVAGTGTIDVTGTDATALNATTIGTGHITIAGRAVRARFVVNGAGAIRADDLTASDVTVRLDGPGEVVARARNTADVTNIGLGHVDIGGSAKCLVKAVSSGSVTCGASAVR